MRVLFLGDVVGAYGCELLEKRLRALKKQYAADVVVRCASQDKGAVARNNCAASCIGCKLCEKNCPQDAIHVIDNVAVIDYTKCTSCGVCVEKCPRKVLLDIHEDGKVAPVAKAGA